MLYLLEFYYTRVSILDVYCTLSVGLIPAAASTAATRRCATMTMTMTHPRCIVVCIVVFCSCSCCCHWCTVVYAITFYCSILLFVLFFLFLLLILLSVVCCQHLLLCRHLSFIIICLPLLVASWCIVVSFVLCCVALCHKIMVKIDMAPLAGQKKGVC